MQPILETVELSKSFGGVRALNELSLQVLHGEILAIIGPNGAGKTTLFNLISRIHPATSGDIVFKGQSLRRFKQHQVAAAGIGRTFQNLQVFGAMTVLENILVGCHTAGRTGVFSAALRLPTFARDENCLREKALQCLDIVGLSEQAQLQAGNLPMGLQRHLELARALATAPELVLLDEPAAGLTTHEADALATSISQLRRDLSLTFALIEHDMNVVMDVSDRVVVIDQGCKLSEGTPEQVQSDPAVLKAYLGEELPT
jgi:branched-chain amino acid transport system ATP-binding protein